MKYLNKVILLIIVLFPLFVLAKPVESTLAETRGIIKKFDVDRVSIENVGYTRYSNLLNSGSSGVIIKGAVYNHYVRDVQLKITLTLYDKDKNELQDFVSNVDISADGTSVYQQNIYAEDLFFALDDIGYFSLTAELGTDVEILEKGENDVYYIEDYFIKVNVNENNIYNIKESFLATFRNKVVPIERGISFRHLYVRDDGIKVNKRAIISNIDVDQYFKVSTEEGLRTLLIGKEDKTNTKRNYSISYDYNVGNDTLRGNDEFFFYLINNWDVKVDGISFEIVMPKSFLKDDIAFVDNNGISLDNVVYDVNDNVITGSIEGVINPQGAYAIRIKLNNNYFIDTTNNISTLLLACIFVPILFVIVTLLWWFREKKIRRNSIYNGNILFNKNINALELGYLYNGKVKDSDIPSLLFNLANDGYVEIEKQKKNYKIIKIKDYKGNDRVEKIFMQELFLNNDVIDRKDLVISLSKIKEMINHKLNDENRKKKIYSDTIISRKLIFLLMIIVIISLNVVNILIEYQPSVIIWNMLLSIIGYLILLNGLTRKKKVLEKMLYTLVGLILIVIPIVLTSYKAFLVDYIYDLVYIVGILCMLVIISVSNLMSDRTRYGRKMYIKINGYKNYLNKIDKSIINRELKKNKNVLYELLPNAYVLGLSDKIISVSNDIELEGPSWYKVKKFKVDEFYQDFKNIYSDIFIALKSSKK